MNRRKRTPQPAPPAWRRVGLLVAFACAVVGLELRTAWQQLVRADFYVAHGEQRQLRQVEIPVHRGQITDRNGRTLAGSTPLNAVVVNPKEFPLAPSEIHELAETLGLDPAEVERSITSHLDREFVYVARQQTPAKAAAALELGIAGVSTPREYGRFYPTHEVTCQLIGFTDIDGVGIDGFEYVYDDWLTGVPGLKTIKRDKYGRAIEDVDLIKAAEPGRDLRLSIDLELQWPAYLELKRAVAESNAAWGSLVILDVQTGEVLALANQPFCNQNIVEQRTAAESHRNRAITDLIDPGSSIKPIVLSAALASGYSPETELYVPKYLEVGNEILTNDSHELGRVSLTTILAESSSVGMGLIGQGLDSKLLWQTFKNFGFGEATNTILGNSEAKGGFKNYEDWYETEQATLAYGYGISMTPLQLARAYAAIASGGLLPEVSFEVQNRAPRQRRIMSRDIAADLTRMMEVVVADGTGWRAAIPNYSVAGKTGTAQMLIDRRYSDEHFRAIFAGFAPASRPRFVAVVVIEDPRGAAYHGGDVAAPVFARVMSKALRLRGVAPDALVDAGPTLMSRAEVSQ
jgi:cell division protein FtsI (penicillin-binding protein 3)